MNRHELIAEIKSKGTFLCVGLDPDVNKIPKHLLEEEDSIFAFNKLIVNATAEYCVAFKPNTAFYEAYGVTGITSLQKTCDYIKENYPKHFLIADAKRGDIGNTSTMYAHAAFERLRADAVTVAPYMGKDSVDPFLHFANKWAIVLALTSNSGSMDFQQIKINDKELFIHVIETTAKWGNENNMMFVVGATKAQLLEKIRKLIPDHFLLIPGIGAQGGNLEEVCKYGLNSDVGLLVNSSRNILYASNHDNFDIRAGEEARKIKQEMEKYIL